MTNSGISAAIIHRVLFFIMMASPAVGITQTAVIDAGQLAGFDDIHIGGMSYDVRFIDGSFLSIHGDSSGLDFGSIDLFTAASNALLEAISE